MVKPVPVPVVAVVAAAGVVVNPDPPETILTADALFIADAEVIVTVALLAGAAPSRLVPRIVIVSLAT
jgi:hypothetical protein